MAVTQQLKPEVQVILKADPPPINVKELKSGAQYLLEKPLYADDRIFAEGERIEYNGIPNETMKPLNEEARFNLELFYKANGGATPELATIAEEAYKNRPREVNAMGERQPIPLTGGPAAEGVRAAQPKPETVKHIPQAEKPKYVRPIATQGNMPPEVPTPGV